jgi:prepilin-type N-terminal cleavage/methylation domain-containing protein
MKFCRTPVSKSRGFTLIELLVVVVIIAILAGLVLGVGTVVVNNAKRVKAANMANQLQASVTAYYTEYSAYPIPTGVTTDFEITDTDTGNLGGAPSPAWPALIECLSGMIKPANGQTSTETTFSNTHQIKFLQLNTADVGSGTGNELDAPLNPIPPDATHLYFNIAIDADYDGVLGVSPSAITNLPNFTTINTTTAPATGGSGTGGIAIWANCVGSSTKYNSNQWVKTY